MNFPSVRNSEISCTFVNYSEYKILFQCMEDLSEPEFSVNTETTCTGFVAFTDESTNAPTAWKWDFGDGNTSNVQNPEHQYLENGTYSVSLTVTNQYGSNTITKVAFIIVEMPDPPVIEDIIVCKEVWKSTAPCFLVRKCKSFRKHACSSSKIRLKISPSYPIRPGLFYIKGLAKSADYRYAVTGISGKTVIENQSLNSELVDLSQLPDGIYFMTVSTADDVRTLKLINMK